MQDGYPWREKRRGTDWRREENRSKLLAVSGGNKASDWQVYPTRHSFVRWELSLRGPCSGEKCLWSARREERLSSGKPCCLHYRPDEIRVGWCTPAFYRRIRVCWQTLSVHAVCGYPNDSVCERDWKGGRERKRRTDRQTDRKIWLNFFNAAELSSMRYSQRPEGTKTPRRRVGGRLYLTLYCHYQHLH